jgi:hypothetical protein
MTSVTPFFNAWFVSVGRSGVRRLLQVINGVTAC